MKRLIVGGVAACLCLATADGKSKKPKHNWEQGEVCRGSACVANIAFVNEGGGNEWFAGTFENKTVVPLHSCIFTIPLVGMDGSTIYGEATALGPSEIPAGSSYLFHATIPHGWDEARQVNIACAEAQGTFLFRFPIIWNYWNQRAWRKAHENDPPARDPNQP